jgi:hypothetical protein
MPFPVIPGEELDKMGNCGIMIMLRFLVFASVGAARAIDENGTELMTLISFWAFGHTEVWAPATVSGIFMRRLMGALIAPEDSRKTEYVPKGRRPKRRIQKMISGYWARCSKLLVHWVYSYCKRQDENLENLDTDATETQGATHQENAVHQKDT